MLTEADAGRKWISSGLQPLRRTSLVDPWGRCWSCTCSCGMVGSCSALSVVVEVLIQPGQQSGRLKDILVPAGISAPAPRAGIGYGRAPRQQLIDCFVCWMCPMCSGGGDGQLWLLWMETVKGEAVLCWGGREEAAPMERGSWHIPASQLWSGCEQSCSGREAQGKAKLANQDSR